MDICRSKKRFRVQFFINAEKNNYIELFKAVWCYKRKGARYYSSDLSYKCLDTGDTGDLETLKWVKENFAHDWSYHINWQYKGKSMREYGINTYMIYLIEFDRFIISRRCEHQQRSFEIFKWLENDIIGNREAYEELLKISQDAGNDKITEYLENILSKF